MDFTRYPGAKTNSGIIQFLINRIPYHTRYCELFAGSAQLCKHKKPAAIKNVLCDIDDRVAKQLQMQMGDRVDVYRFAALDFIAQAGMKSFTRSDFMYLDPPYPFISRRNGKKYYRYEMSDDDHVQLLTTVLQLDANIIISTRQNDMYDKYLQLWRKETFETVDRQGAVTEVVYMNYQQPAILHQYNYWGGDCWERQGVKRKIARFEKKIKQLPVYEQHLFIQTMIKENPELVQHFMLNRE